MVPVTTTTTHATTTAALSPSHHLPEVRSWRGSAGGSPDGRRRRRTRAMAGALDRTAGPVVPAEGSACGTGAMPRNAAPRTAPRPSPFVPRRSYGGFPRGAGGDAMRARAAVLTVLLLLV